MSLHPLLDPLLGRMESIARVGEPVSLHDLERRPRRLLDPSMYRHVDYRDLGLWELLATHTQHWGTPYGGPGADTLWSNPKFQPFTANGTLDVPSWAAWAYCVCIGSGASGGGGSVGPPSGLNAGGGGGQGGMMSIAMLPARLLANQCNIIVGAGRPGVAGGTVASPNGTGGLNGLPSSIQAIRIGATSLRVLIAGGGLAGGPGTTAAYGLGGGSPAKLGTTGVAESLPQNAGQAFTFENTVGVWNGGQGGRGGRGGAGIVGIHGGIGPSGGGGGGGANGGVYQNGGASGQTAWTTGPVTQTLGGASRCAPGADAAHNPANTPMGGMGGGGGASGESSPTFHNGGDGGAGGLYGGGGGGAGSSGTGTGADAAGASGASAAGLVAVFFGVELPHPTLGVVNREPIHLPWSKRIIKGEPWPLSINTGADLSNETHTFSLLHSSGFEVAEADVGVNLDLAAEDPPIVIPFLTLEQTDTIEVHRLAWCWRVNGMTMLDGFVDVVGPTNEIGAT